MEIAVEGFKLQVASSIIINGIDLKIPNGSIIALLGPNGAGKTTFCKGLLGILKPISGRILANGYDITTLPTYKRVEMGFTYVPERAGILERLNIEENLKVGAVRKKARDKLYENLELVYNIFPWLKVRRKEKASVLSGGQRQMLSLMRALMNEPEFLILDEPSQGVYFANIKIIYETISSIFIQEKKISVIITEQLPTYLRDIADKVHLLSAGRIITTISREQLEDHESIWKLLVSGG
jgi:branched-chain amino acid transport system ATP-binding protein